MGVGNSNLSAGFSWRPIVYSDSVNDLRGMRGREIGRDILTANGQSKGTQPARQPRRKGTAQRAFRQSGWSRTIPWEGQGVTADHPGHGESGRLWLWTSQLMHVREQEKTLRSFE